MPKVSIISGQSRVVRVLTLNSLQPVSSGAEELALLRFLRGTGKAVEKRGTLLKVPCEKEQNELFKFYKWLILIFEFFSGAEKRVDTMVLSHKERKSVALVNAFTVFMKLNMPHL
jgi:hypothetical protein